MTRPAATPRFIRLFAFIAVLLCAFAPPLCPAPHEQPETEALRGDFLTLKKKFERDVKKVRDQKILSAMALETAARSWALAAAFAGADIEAVTRKKAALEKAAKSKNWDARELAALDYCYEAILSLIRKRAASAGQAPLLAEIDSIAAKTAEQLKGAAAKTDGNMESRVALSGALSGIMAVAVKSVGGGAMEPPIQLIVKGMLARANKISDRGDIHYRAKLSLLYANNVEGLTALTFLLGHNAGPPLSGDLARVHGSWNEHLRGASLPDTLSLSWTAQYQAALPLAFWLATH